MAETITYPDSGYGIMPLDTFNQYLSFTNQRKAATGINAPYSDQKAFWEGAMDAVVKNSATRAAQNLERKRLDANIAYQNRQLDQADEARRSQAISGLATFPMTYLLYDALGVGRQPQYDPKGNLIKPAEPSALGSLWGFVKRKLSGDNYGIMPQQPDAGTPSPTPQDLGVPSEYNDSGVTINASTSGIPDWTYSMPYDMSPVDYGSNVSTPDYSGVGTGVGSIPLDYSTIGSDVTSNLGPDVSWGFDYSTLDQMLT